jgi:L-iditol 2-dehydrogenase
MHAAQVVAPGKIDLIETLKPALKPGHALVRPLLLSLCSSDVRMLYYAPPDEYPFAIGTTGHEMVGLVEAVDGPNSAVRVGDVALTLVPDHTAMAEYVVAPLVNVLVLRDGRPPDHLLMAQQLGTVVLACTRLPNVVGKDAVVIGQGSAGLFFCAMLRRMGAKRVIGLDVKEARVAAGRLFGATHTFNSARSDPLQAVKEITDGALADVVIEAAGEADTVNLTPRLVKIGGHLLFFGMPPRNTHVTIDFWTFFGKFCYATSAGATMELDPERTSFRLALDLIARGEIDVAPMLTHRFPFDRVREAYELARTRDDGAVKVVVEMPGC